MRTNIRTSIVAATAIFGLALVAQSGAQGSITAWGAPDDWMDEGQVTNTPLGNDFVQVSAGGAISVALRTNGTLAAWGDDWYGFVSNVPTGSYVSVSAGAEWAVALKSDGSLSAWGADYVGQCDVPMGNNFATVSGGALHGVALRLDGTIVSWGYDDYGSVSNTPAGTFTSVKAGGYHTLALRADGTVETWGWSNFGLMNVPEGTFTAIAAGLHHSVAIRADGSLVSWGSDQFGQVSQTPAGNDFVAVWTGSLSYNTVAMRANGTLVVWGPDMNLVVSNFPNMVMPQSMALGNGHGLAIGGSNVMQQIQTIKQAVDALVAGGAVLPANGHPLHAKLNSVLTKLAEGDVQGAIDSLRAFMNQVAAFVKTGRLSSADGAELIAMAQAVIDLLD